MTVDRTDLTGFGGIWLRLGGEPPYGQEILVPDGAGQVTVQIVANRDYPAGTALWVTMVVWPGSGQANILGFTHSGIADHASPAPLPGQVLCSSPSPFTSETQLDYSVPTRSTVDLTITDKNGRVVRTLNRGERAAGSYSVRWDGRDDAGQELAAGCYFWRLVIDGHLQSIKAAMTK